MKHIKYIILAIATLFTMQSCFDLNEEAFDFLDPNAYYEDENSVKGVVAGVYSVAYNNYMEWFWVMQEFSADQVSWRSWNGGNYGYDEGEKYVLSTHTWTPESNIIELCWENSWEAIGLCNTALDDFAKLTASDLGMSSEKLNSYIAEVRTFRVWCYYNVYELWGGALPLAVDVTSEIPGPADADFNVSSKKIYDYLIKELDESWEALPKNDVNRMNQAANRLMKARLLFNAGPFIGEDRFADCATLCQQIIDGDYGNYTLENDYRRIYSHDNHTSTEIIFAFANTPTQLNQGWLRGLAFFNYDMYKYFDMGGFPFGTWNCTHLAPSYDNAGSFQDGTGSPVCFLDAPYNDKLGAVYERFDDRDIRKKNFTADASGNWEGIFLAGAIKENFGAGNALLSDTDHDGEPLVYVDQLGQFKGMGRPLATVMTPRWGETNSGIRLVRYPFYPDAAGIDYREADEVEMRLAEVYYMLAECKMRSGDLPGGKNLVDDVRERYYSSADWTVVESIPGRGFTAFDLDWMLSEWGKEFLNEGRRRRTDLRRHDKFTQGQWWFFGRATGEDVNVPATRDRKYEWFPLPAKAFLSNPNLKQNPNY